MFETFNIQQLLKAGFHLFELKRLDTNVVLQLFPKFQNALTV
ncbi:hypothetical protein D778_02125 [Xanthomarina gelatinilytica]|uniref:Uncharacterized protein n=1 Tax=Xanthomarina gelatinilytica TaxID=1137281 RepID=M7MMT9_9FLAO|nr:hypothetical protein D778_02125 [Xanthomarina gelatinilytica]